MNRRCFVQSGLAAGAVLPAARAAAAPAIPDPEVAGFRGIGRIKPRPSRTISSSPWGIQAGTLEEKLLARAAEIGVKWTRLGASWPSIERQKGSYDWAHTDSAFRAVLDQGITPFVTLGGGNSLYSPVGTWDDPKLAEIYGRSIAPPTADAAAMKAWLAFVEAAAERYKGQIRYWEIWNEPNHRQYWGAEPNAKDYGRLVRETAAIIRRVDPQALIIGGSTAGLQPDYIDGFLAGGAAQMIDIVTFHNYGPVPEERIYRGIEVLEVLRKHNPKIELWQGECGAPSHSSTRDYRGHSPWGVNIQAKWLLRQALTDTYFLRATMSNYFKLVDTGRRGEMPKRSFLAPIDRVLGNPERGGSRVKTVGVNEKCLLENPSFEPKPGFFAYQNLCALIDGRYAPEAVEYRIRVRDAGIFYGVGAEDDSFPSVPLAAFYRAGENRLAAWWLPWHPAEYLPRYGRIDLAAPGVTFRNPVLVDLLNGRVFEPPAGAPLTSLPLADYPFAMVERSEIGILA